MNAREEASGEAYVFIREEIWREDEREREGRDRDKSGDFQRQRREFTPVTWTVCGGEISLSLSLSFSRFRVKMFFPSSVKSRIAVRITGTIQIPCFLPRKMLLDVSRGKGEANLLSGSYTALAENLRDRSAVNRERSRAAKPSAIEFSAGTIINWLVERCELFRATRTHKGHD